jgi:hypothetical protein
MIKTEPHKEAYGIISSKYGVVLDCYDHYMAGLCIAAASNSPVGCWKMGTKQSVQANCHLVVPSVGKGCRKKIYLRAGVHQPKESATNFYIPPNVELTWDYGDIYDNYKN